MLMLLSLAHGWWLRVSSRSRDTLRLVSVVSTKLNLAKLASGCSMTSQSSQ